MAKRGLYRHNLPAVFSYQHSRKIGLLGGSFNPAHEGHLALSKAAKLAGKFDEIWWLVSPQNPLKSGADMADYNARLAYAKQLAGRLPWLRITQIESYITSRYSYDVVRFLQARAPRAAFTWLMGTDNLLQFPQWYKARALAQRLPFMVIRRQDSFYAAINGKGRHYMRRNLRLITGFHNHNSATALRQAGFWDNR